MTVAASAAAAISSVLVLIFIVCLVFLVTVCAMNIPEEPPGVKCFLKFF
jgi:hypothetical protein